MLDIVKIDPSAKEGFPEILFQISAFLLYKKQIKSRKTLHFFIIFALIQWVFPEILSKISPFVLWLDKKTSKKKYVTAGINVTLCRDYRSGKGDFSWTFV